ncbi:MAG: hypothetical protein IT438_09495 [Phycisphaerales bacterium]|nr:hypothetical protein [Phycisphaerales bacterium]
MVRVKPDRGRSARRAFALVDVMVGAILVGVSLAVLIGLTGRAISAQRRGEELQAAAALADEQLQLVLARGPDDYAKRFKLEGVCDAPFENYHYLLEFAGGTSNEPYTVTCTIWWDFSLSKQSIAIQTLMASRLGGDEDIDPIRAPETAIIRTP